MEIMDAAIMDPNVIIDLLIIGIIASVIMFYFIFLVCFHILDVTNLIVTQLDINIGFLRIRLERLNFVSIY